MILDNLHKDIGTAKDNRTSPIHDWYRFTAGFSYKLVDKIIKEEGLGNNDKIYECFAGCGTTLVSAQKKRISAVGNEGQELLLDVINAKLNWNIDKAEVLNIIYFIKKKIINKKRHSPFHNLLESLYNESDLFQLYFIRDFLSDYEMSQEVNLFLKLSLTQTLHKVSIHPIAIPYISRSKIISSSYSALETFENTALKMLEDLTNANSSDRTSKIYLHDSRLKNHAIEDNECTVCITSPPYLNNLDYGEVSKVCSHFYGITDSWNDVTEFVRKKLVTGATTHYKESEFSIDNWLKQDFYNANKNVMDLLLPSIDKIRIESKLRKGKKSFDILSLYYFEDMYRVLVEMRRVLKKGSKAYLVLGDSAPYGVFIDTTKILGDLALNIGFKSYRIVKIRERGTKWKSLRFRHSLTLSENILVLE